jgi:hypothetical protein
MVVCPKCDKVNRCDCSSCNPNGDTTNLIIVLKDEQLYQCSFCSYKFSIDESFEYDWNKMIKSFTDRISPELCLEWVASNNTNRNKLEKDIDLHSFAFERAFREHFKLDSKYCNDEDIKRLKRDLSIKKILD